MKLKRNPQVVSSKLDKEVCIFNPLNANYINLNSTGSKIWDFLETPKTYFEILNQLKSEFESEDQIIEKEVNSFINDCIDQNIVSYL